MRRIVLGGVLALLVTLGNPVAQAGSPSEPPPAALAGLCQAWQSGQGGLNGAKQSATAFVRLANLAASSDQSVDQLCGGDGTDEALGLVGCDGETFDSVTYLIRSPGGPQSPSMVGTGGTPPYVYSESGLADGFTFAADGTVSHVDALEGNYPFTFTVSDSVGDSVSVPASVTVDFQDGLPSTC